MIKNTSNMGCFQFRLVFCIVFPFLFASCKQAMEAACFVGHALSCNRLAVAEIREKTIPNWDYVYGMLLKGCAGDVYSACDLFASIIAAGGDKKDIPLILGFKQKACDGNYGGACLVVGANEAIKGNAAGAKKYYEKGCDLDSMASCTAYAKVEPLKNIADNRLGKACRGKSVDECEVEYCRPDYEACLLLGKDAYSWKEMDTAKSLLGRACDLGKDEVRREACKLLKDVNNK